MDEFAILTDIVSYTNVINYQVAAYSVDMQEGHTYEFMVEGGNKIDGIENSITVHWGKAGHGYVKLIESSTVGCIADTNTMEVIIGSLGLEEVEHQKRLAIYPNPCEGATRLRYQIKDPPVDGSSI